MMYGMKDACKKTGLTYEALKFYCNQGLVPHVKRDANNRRLFDDQDIAWIKSLLCLKSCGMSIQEIREYLDLGRLGPASIPRRRHMLEQKRDDLQKAAEKIRESIAYIDQKQQFFDDVLAGRTPYCSSLFPEGVR